MTLALAQQAFLEGYRLSVAGGATRNAERIARDVLALGMARAPFAFEGAAMGCRMLDVRDGRRSCAELNEETEARWAPFLKLGVGCAAARLDHRPPLDPMELDGYGFQRGLLDGISHAPSSQIPSRAERGRGRALWFLTGGRAHACAGAAGRSIDPMEFWRGVGTACAFAGDPMDQASRLEGLAGAFRGSLAAGVADGVRLWETLQAEAPPRVLRVAASLTT